MIAGIPVLVAILAFASVVSTSIGLVLAVRSHRA